MRVVDYPGGDALADVGRQGAHEALVRIHGEREEALVLDPPVAIEAFLERHGALPVRLRILVLAYCPREDGEDLLSGVPVALELAGTRRIGNDGAVVVDDGVSAVLPALVLRSLRRPR